MELTRHGHVHSRKDRGNATVLGEPVRHDEALETQLVLQDSVLQPRVLAGVGVVNAVICAHDGTNTSLDRVLERPKVDLVQCSVIDV